MDKDIIKNPIEPIKRIVVKVGSSLLIDSSKAEVKKVWLASLVEDIAKLYAQGKQVIIVSSGATSLGRNMLDYGDRDLELNERQAAAACGQIPLMEAWREAFTEHDIDIAQTLITADDTEVRERFLNARNTFDTLLRIGVVPIVNENDTVSTHGCLVGDNDRLAARLSQVINAGLLVLLSDIDGLYSDDPTENPDATHVPLVPEITEGVESMAGEARSNSSSGGMKTKIDAATIATASGTHMVICNGEMTNPLAQLAGGAKHTLFLGTESPLSSRKEWILGTLEPKGSLLVDDGAAKALKLGNSLLPMGVVRVDGEFSRGDAVWIKGKDGSKLAKGLSTYNSDDAKRIKGNHSDQIKEILGFKARDVLVHRDDMVML